MKTESLFTPLDTFQHAERADFGTTWSCQSDRSLGGESQGELHIFTEAKPAYLRLSGTVSLKNTLRPEDGGFIQAALPLLYARHLYNASAYDGVRIRCALSPATDPTQGHYEIRLQTRELSMPWQYYGHAFQPTHQIQSLDLCFDDFQRVNTSHPLNSAYLLNLSVVAGQAVFSPELNIYELGFYAHSHP